MNFDEAVSEASPKKLSKGRPFVVDLVLEDLEMQGRSDDRHSLEAALRDPRNWSNKKLSRVIKYLDCGRTTDEKAVRNWRERYLEDQ